MAMPTFAQATSLYAWQRRLTPGENCKMEAAKASTEAETCGDWIAADLKYRQEVRKCKHTKKVKSLASYAGSVCAM